MTPCMMRPVGILLFSAFLFGSVACSRPNLVILFADNLGYNDVGILGGTSKTPNIDSIAKHGLSLTNWNSVAHLCSASRASLLTGRYPIRTGVYPATFQPSAKYGMLPNETTLAEYLTGYKTSIVGKWHLGHRHQYLPTNQGFDEWLGIPYHMSGGSIDSHECGFDANRTVWLPLYQEDGIVQQPVQVQTLAQRYAKRATDFIQNSSSLGTPFFLYMAFSHVHQLCAPAYASDLDSCQWASPAFSKDSPKATFQDAVQEMDWIAGEILNELRSSGVMNNTLVLFTSDNGPWIAQSTSCSGSKGPFEGTWLQKHVEQNCTACPHDFISSSTTDRPRRCISKYDNTITTDGIHCGMDSGLGSSWEANLRMPALVQWPGKIAPGSSSDALVSTLDVVPTVLSMFNISIPNHVDGIDISNVLFGNNQDQEEETDRPLFFWRDGFEHGPLPPPYGRLDVVAMKFKGIKAWFWTKSAHYNNDVEQYHDPPLLFDTLKDPAEAFPLAYDKYYNELIKEMLDLVQQHKASVDWTFPLALAKDPKYIPCVDEKTSCRTTTDTTSRLKALE